MKKKLMTLLLACALALPAGSIYGEILETTECTEVQADAVLADGVYTAKFDTDSSMFRVNEACEGRGILTVKDGEMTIHVTLLSKKILNLYPGMAEEAQKDGAVLLEPVVDQVTYADGYTEEAYGFDIPVPYLDEVFYCALVGTKGTWYDHEVSVSDVQPYEQEPVTAEALGLSDGTYQCVVTLAGGSGRASVESPAVITVKDGKITATLVWSSPNYDFMMVGEDKYLPVNEEGNSVFEIPAAGFDAPLAVSADTVAMSTPHLIDYTICLDSTTIE